MERVLGWIMKLFPGGPSRRRTNKRLSYWIHISWQESSTTLAYALFRVCLPLFWWCEGGRDLYILTPLYNPFFLMERKWVYVDGVRVTIDWQNRIVNYLREGNKEFPCCSHSVLVSGSNFGGTITRGWKEVRDEWYRKEGRKFVVCICCICDEQILVLKH